MLATRSRLLLSAATAFTTFAYGGIAFACMRPGDISCDGPGLIVTVDDPRGTDRMAQSTIQDLLDDIGRYEQPRDDPIFSDLPRIIVTPNDTGLIGGSGPSIGGSGPSISGLGHSGGAASRGEPGNSNPGAIEVPPAAQQEASIAISEAQLEADRTAFRSYEAQFSDLLRITEQRIASLQAARSANIERISTLEGLVQTWEAETQSQLLEAGQGLASALTDQIVDSIRGQPSNRMASAISDLETAQEAFEAFRQIDRGTTLMEDALVHHPDEIARLEQENQMIDRELTHREQQSSLWRGAEQAARSAAENAESLLTEEDAAAD